MGPSTADLCDAHGEKVRVIQTSFLDFGGTRRFSGKVATVKVLEDNVLVRRALETPGEGRVLVVDGGGSLRCALVGDQLAALGVKNGWAGVVVLGAIRDSAAIAALPIGVKALGTNPRKSHKGGLGERDVPVELGGVTVRPGEWIAADEDGVIVAEGPLG